jgi:sarcosine oxidase
MPNSEFDAIVVGVGGMGSAAVAHLAGRGLDVLGLERYDVPHAQGSSHGLTRIIRLPQYEDPTYVPLVRRALDLWRDLNDWYGHRLFHPTGTIDFGPPDSDIIAGSRRSCSVHGIDHELLSGAEVRDRFPGYGLPEEYRAVYQPDGGFLHVERCTVAHVERAHAHGATVRAREGVEDWTSTETGVRVTTDRGVYEAESLVVTAGAWTGELLPSLAPYLTPERQVLGWFQPDDPKRFAPERFPVFVADVPEGHYYGFPRYEVPGFKIGKYNHRGETGTPADLKREPDRIDERVLRDCVDAHFPRAAGPTMQLSTCLFTNSPDEEFLIDTHPEYDSVVVAAGFSGHGFKFASVVGEILADLTIDGDTDHPIDRFRVDRFA